MNRYGDRPMRNYMNESSWEKLYASTQLWKSDLEFFKEDLRFLENHIDKYFIWMKQRENVGRVREIELNTLMVDRQCTDLLNKMSTHLFQIGRHIQNCEVETSQLFRTEHGHLKDSIAAFVKSFKENRKEVFKTTEWIADSEQLIKIF